MNRPRIVFLDQGSLGADADLRALRQTADKHGWRYLGYEYTETGQVAGRIRDAQVVVTNKCALGAAHLDKEASRELRLIIVAATGCDIIDAEACAAAGVEIRNVRDYASECVAQHTLALILALSHKLRTNHDHCRNGRWSASRHFCLFDDIPVELSGKDAGIVGYGAIGRRVAGYLSSLGARVHLAARDDEDRRPQRVALKDLLPRADILSLHCPLTPQTRHLISARELALMKPHSLLINTARGGLTDERALAQALLDGTIGGAGLDVLEREPPGSSSPLLRCPSDRLILTPHIAWAGVRSRASLIEGLVRNFEAFVRRAHRYDRPQDSDRPAVLP